MNRMHPLRWLAVPLVAVFLLGPVHWSSAVRSANLTDVSVTLSTPRLSYSAILDASNVVGTNTVSIDTTPAAAPSVSTANIFEGDTVLIGSNDYTVGDVTSTSTFNVTTVLASGDADDNDPVIVTRRPAMTAVFTTVTSLQTDWDLRVLVPAPASDPDDGIPDQDGWDYGSATPGDIDITCPASFTGTQGIANVTIGSQDYHSFTCNYDGVSPVAPGTTYTVVVGNATDPTASLINPSAEDGHTEGFADTHNIIVQQLDDSSTLVDQTTAQVAVIEAVRVTASVPSQITFQITGQGTGSPICGNNPSVVSTATVVPLGELLISSFTYAAQLLSVSTNANDGYAVTAVAENQLHRVGETCPGDATTGGCIPDTTGNGADITNTTPGLWTSTAAKGFGYSLQVSSLGPSASAAFQHNSVTGSCAGASGSCWKQFSDAEDSQAPQTIYSSTGVADDDNVYTCYKAVVSADQAAGSDYSTSVTYNATANF